MFGIKIRRDPAAQLKILMAKRDLNTQELADISGVSATTISGIRSGRIERPRRSTADALCDALNVRIEDIFAKMY